MVRRVITCSRQPFPEDCPWEMGEEDHIQLDLADPQSTMDAVAQMQARRDAKQQQREAARRAALEASEKSGK